MKGRIVKNIIWAVLLLGVVVFPMVFSYEPQAAVKYGADGEETEEYKAAREAYVEGQKKYVEATIAKENGKANGTAGDDLVQIKNSDGTVTVSDVKGCYNTKSVSSAYPMAQEYTLSQAVNCKSGETPYVEMMDSKCGPNAQAALAAASVAAGCPTGPMIDINVGKKSGAGITFNDPIVGVSGSYGQGIGVAFSVSAPAGYVCQPGYSLAMLCVLPDGTTKIIPNMFQSVDPLGRTYTYQQTRCSFFVSDPQGVYMLTQIPSKENDALATQICLDAAYGKSNLNGKIIK